MLEKRRQNVHGNGFVRIMEIIFFSAEKCIRPEVEHLTRPSSADRDKSARIKRVESLRREKTMRSKPDAQNQHYDEDTQKILEGIERLKMRKVAISRSASAGDVMLQRDIPSSSSSVSSSKLVVGIGLFPLDLVFMSPSVRTWDKQRGETCSIKAIGSF